MGKKPDREKECAEVSIQTCGIVRKWYLDIIDEHEKKDPPSTPVIQQIILSALKKTANEYFAKKKT